MLYLLLAQIVSLLFDLFAIARRSQPDKDLEILLLRQQLRILQRRYPKHLAFLIGGSSLSPSSSASLPTLAATQEP